MFIILYDGNTRLKKDIKSNFKYKGIEIAKTGDDYYFKLDYPLDRTSCLDLVFDGSLCSHRTFLQFLRSFLFLILCCFCFDSCILYQIIVFVKRYFQIFLFYFNILFRLIYLYFHYFLKIVDKSEYLRILYN